MKITLSVDDGCASDVRVADLASKYEMDCVFYWPVEWHSLAYDHGYEPLSYIDALTIASQFEIGSHTVTHRHLTKLNDDEALEEIAGSKNILQSIFSQEISKFCPPRGYTNDRLTAATLEIYKSQRLTKGENLVHVHPDSGANNNKRWQDCVTEKTTELWFHSWELDKYNLWQELEEWLYEYTRS